MSNSIANISAVLERVGDVFFSLNNDWQFEYANASAEYFFSKQDEELVGKNIWEVFPQLKQRPFYAACQLANEKKEAISLEEFYDKASIWYEKNIYPSANGFSIFFRDITKIKNAEKEIKIFTERFKLVTTATNDMIWDWNLLTDELWWNSNYNNLFGYDDKSVIHHIDDWVKSVYEDDRGRVKEGIYKVIELKQNFWTDDYRYVKKDGTILNIYDRGYVLYTDDGKPYRMIGSMLNITDRIKSENTILKEKKFSDSIINSLPGIFYLHDDKGKLVRWNKNLEKITGFSKKDIAAMASPLELFIEQDKDLILQKAREVFAKEFAFAEATFLTKKKEKIPLFFTGCKVDFDEGPGVAVIGIDYSEKKEAEQLLKKSYEDIRSLATHLTHIREEERKRIGREIHDELGQQLTAVKMDIAWIDKNTSNENEGVKNKLKNVIDLLDGSNKSVRRILTELSPGIIDNNGLVAALERLNTQFTSTTNVPVEFTNSKKSIQLNQEIANCIFRVYQEALTNIMRYANATKVCTSLSIQKDKMMVHIEDNGNGFDTSTDKNTKSFGILGMKERVLAKEGIFELMSTIGKGTKISIYLPYSP